MALVCESECAPISWDYIGLHVTFGFVVWVLLLAGGIGLFIFSATANTEGIKVKAYVWRQRLHNNWFFTVTYILLALVQFAQFAARTYTNEVGLFSYLVELLACLFYATDYVLLWTDVHLTSFEAGLRFMFSEGIIDCFLIISVACMPMAVGGVQSWGSLSFLASLHLLQAWDWLLHLMKAKPNNAFWMVTRLVGNSVCLVLFGAMTMLTLERLGDPGIFADFNADKWNTVSAVYFVIVTVSTVGYGDLAPVTYMGRLLAVVTIFGGISFLALAVQRVVQVMSIQSSGRGSYESGVRNRHIIVAGCPTASMIQEFIAELFHPDHSEEADDLHVVILFQPGKSAHTIMQEVHAFVRQKAYIHIAAKVHLLQGSLLNGHDLQRVDALKASCFFILPNTLCDNPMQEDTENIIRMMALRRFVPDARMILLLLHSESQHILHDATAGTEKEMTQNLTCIAIDQFKLELVGKSCEVTGFGTFIANLCKSIEEADETEGLSKPMWQSDYERGVGNELYEIELSRLYSEREAIFCEVVVDVLEQTGGTCYLIGLVETNLNGKKKVLVNPGPRYKIKPPALGVHTAGIFIAADREAVVQCEGGMVFLGRRERPRVADLAIAKDAADDHAGNVKLRSQQPEVDERLLAYMNAKQGKTARQLVTLVKQHQRAMEPARPPLKLLAQGGHILFLCVGASANEEIRVGVEHFVRPLRRKYNLGDNAVPIVVLAPQKPRDWENVCDQDQVYFLKGSPLSHFDIERANFHGASTIFICNVGGHTGGKPSQSWMVDSEVICCVRLLESRLEPGALNVVIADLSIDSNHPFLPAPPTSNVGAARQKRDEDRWNERRGSLSSWGSAVSSIASIASAGGAALKEAANGPRNLSNERLLQKVPEYYYQPRFASGQLFVGTVITSLAVNTFYNPSLYELVRVMVASNVVMLKVPPNWVGKSYQEFFDHLLWSQSLLCISIFRRADPDLKEKVADEEGAQVVDPANSKKKFAYIYTAPPAKETTMLKTDRVMCFGSAQFRTKAQGDR